MTAPITFVDYLIIGPGGEGQLLATLLLRAKRGVVTLLPGGADPNHSKGHTIQEETQVKNISRQGFPHGSFRVLTQQSGHYQARYLVMAPNASNPLDFSVFDPPSTPARDDTHCLPLLTGELGSVNIANLYFLGIDQRRTSVKPAERAIYLSQVLAYRNHDVAFPCRVLPMAPEALARAVLGRISREKSPGQVSEAHGDLILPDKTHVNARYYEDLPIDTFPNCGFGHRVSYYTVQLKEAAPAEPAANTKLYPKLVVRRCGRHRDELVIGGDQKWQWDELIQALSAFFSYTVAIP